MELEDQFNEIREENDLLKDRVRKLRTIQKGLSSKEFNQTKASLSKTRRPASAKGQPPQQNSKCEYHY